MTSVGYQSANVGDVPIPVIGDLVADHFWVIPTLQSIHIICVALILISSLFIDLRLMGVAGCDKPLRWYADRFLSWIWIPVIILVFTGALQITAEPKRAPPNHFFQTKMALLVAAVVMTWFLQKTVRANAEVWDDSPSQARLLGGVMLITWVAIIFLGRLVAYIG